MAVALNQNNHLRRKIPSLITCAANNIDPVGYEESIASAPDLNLRDSSVVQGILTHVFWPL